jgi:hypothetical protein
MLSQFLETALLGFVKLFILYLSVQPFHHRSAKRMVSEVQRQSRQVEGKLEFYSMNECGQTSQSSII